MQKSLLHWIGLLIIPLLAASAGPAVSADEAAQRNRIEQRIKLTQGYLGSKTAARIDASDNTEARQMLEQARDLFTRGQQAFERDKLDEAQQSLDLALQRFTAAGTALSRGTRQAQQLSGEIESIRTEIDAYLDSFNTALAEKGPAMAGLLDQQYVTELLSRAERSRSDGDFRSAKSLLDEAKQNVVAALVKIRNNETVVYAVEFQPPADEFRYESERYREYRMLGEKLLSEGEFAESRVKLFEQLRQSGDQISRDADAIAGDGDYATAIGRMEEAVKKLVQGLRVLGVPLSM